MEYRRVREADTQIVGRKVHAFDDALNRFQKKNFITKKVILAKSEIHQLKSGNVRAEKRTLVIL
jgi:tmRNA-binding protein